MPYPRQNSAPFAFPKIILGTMTWGEQNTEAEARQQLDWAYDNGIRFLDTAELYPVRACGETQGRTEEYIGRWLKGKDRSALTIASKVAGPGRAWIRGGRFTVAGMREALEGSLRRLQTDVIDLYQIHWPARGSLPVFGATRFVPPADPGSEVPVREQLEAMAEFVREGKIRAVGLSNETPWGVCEFARLADECGLPRIVSLQNPYSLADRQVEQALDEVCWREGVAILAYSPLAAGTLTGKYLSPGTGGRFRVFKGFSPRYTRPVVPRAVTRYVDIARRHGLTPEQLALGFVCSRWFITSAILGATSLAQLQADVKACGTKLSEEVMAEIEAVHAEIPNPAI